MRAWFVVGGLGAVLAAGCSSGPQADTDSPIVVITSPMADSTVGGAVSFSAQVIDAFGVKVVKFFVDNVQIGEVTTTPYSVSWGTRSAGNGRHALRVEATDTSGNTGLASIGVTVDNTRQ